MPLLGPATEGRFELFYQLKPLCVALSQSTLALNGGKSNMQDVADQLEILHKFLQESTNHRQHLDAKLADYVFFPVSQVLKASQKISIRCLELCLEILAILCQYGWKHSIQPQSAAQIIILCTLMAEKNPKGFAFSSSTDELQTAAFCCLRHVFVATSHSNECRTFFTSETNFPQIGHTITIILNGILEGRSVETQLAASNALKSLSGSVMNRELCASFLPGIVSKLTRALAPTTKLRRNSQVLLVCLQTLTNLLKTTLSDDVGPAEQHHVKQKQSAIDKKWIETAATQLKPALSSVMQLKGHSHNDVKEGLAELCLMLLEHCRHSLANVLSMVIEALLTIAGGQHSESKVRIKFEMLLRVDPSIGALLKEIIYGWLSSLPTIMQGADEDRKVQRIQQLRTAYALVGDSGSDTNTLDRMLASGLRDTALLTLQDFTVKQASTLVSPVRPLNLDLAELDHPARQRGFTQPLVQYRGQEDIMKQVEDFTRLISSSSASSAFAGDLIRELRASQGEAQLANFWLLLTATQSALVRKDDMNDFLDVRNDDVNVYQEYLEELYSFSLSVLIDGLPINDPVADSGANDWRLRALALRTLALRAQIAGADFRPELIDALYPVLHTLATPAGEHDLQSDALTTLSVFTSACGYRDVKALIVENADYLTNAVALKLNAFDVSPQAPQVLVMMVRLAGPTVLPFLEDTVDSIFAVLESFHGYVPLVEVLFHVLAVMAEEGARAPLLAVGDKGEREGMINWTRERWELTSIDGLLDTLKDHTANKVEEKRLRDQKREPAPQRPWKTRVEEVSDDADEFTTADQGTQPDETNLEQLEQQTADPQPDEEDPPPPAPKTYNLLFKITEHTQHFIPSASPSLRTSLLSLIRTTIPALARHENSFLPLINTLWPEIVSRLDDPEDHVKAMALETVSLLCDYAGEFMRSRIVHLWPAFGEIYSQVQSGNGALARAGVREGTLAGCKSGMLVPADFTTNTSAHLLWNALVGTLSIVAKTVPLPPELFDEVLHMLGPLLELRDDVREALEMENKDAVWLFRMNQGSVEVPEIPVEPEGKEWKFAPVRVR